MTVKSKGKKLYWMRHRFQDNVPRYGTSTHRRQICDGFYLDAIRSDGFMFWVSVKNPAEFSARSIAQIHAELCVKLKTKLDVDAYYGEGPLIRDAFKWMAGWVEGEPGKRRDV